jgi:hypothetical protein
MDQQEKQMSLQMSKSGSLVALLVTLLVASGSQAQTYYSVTGGGGQAQIGDGLPLPAQDQVTPMGAPIGTGTMFPPLLIPVAPNKLVKQTNGADPKKMTVPPGVFRRIPTTNMTTMGVPAPLVIGVALNNPTVLQVRTTLSFSGPANVKGSMTFMAGQRVNNVTTYLGTPLGAKAKYTSKTGARFGGVSQTRVKNLGSIGVWVDSPNIPLPCVHTKFGGTRNNCTAFKLPAYPQSLGAAGGPKGNKVVTPGTPPAVPPQVFFAIPNTTGIITMSLPKSPGIALNNKATSIGFPWTTGQISLSQPAALGGKENFKITGMDGRVAGVGTISLVSSALSKRVTSGPNSNRSWARYTLPEPGAVLGAAAALSVLGICHALVRRRSR